MKTQIKYLLILAALNYLYADATATKNPLYYEYNNDSGYFYQNKDKTLVKKLDYEDSTELAYKYDSSVIYYDTNTDTVTLDEVVLKDSVVSADDLDSGITFEMQNNTLIIKDSLFELKNFSFKSEIENSVIYAENTRFNYFNTYSENYTRPAIYASNSIFFTNTQYKNALSTDANAINLFIAKGLNDETNYNNTLIWQPVDSSSDELEQIVKTINDNTDKTYHIATLSKNFDTNWNDINFFTHFYISNGIVISDLELDPAHILTQAIEDGNIEYIYNASTKAKQEDNVVSNEATNDVASVTSSEETKKQESTTTSTPWIELNESAVIIKKSEEKNDAEAVVVEKNTDNQIAQNDEKLTTKETAQKDVEQSDKTISFDNKNKNIEKQAQRPQDLRFSLLNSASIKLDEINAFLYLNNMDLNTLIKRTSELKKHPSSSVWSKGSSAKIVYDKSFVYKDNDFYIGADKLSQFNNFDIYAGAFLNSSYKYSSTKNLFKQKSFGAGVYTSIIGKSAYFDFVFWLFKS